MLKVGEIYFVKNLVVIWYWLDNLFVVFVDLNGIVKVNVVGKVNIILYKGISVFGVVYVIVW